MYANKEQPLILHNKQIKQKSIWKIKKKKIIYKEILL